MILGSDVLISVLFTLFVVMVVSHLFYGYKWAKFVVVLVTLSFVVTQFFIFKNAFTDGWTIAFIAMSIALIINALVLLRSKVVAEFLLRQAANRSKVALIILKGLRLIFLAAILVGLASDLIRLFV
jgi:hypothetical protein